MLGDGVKVVIVQVSVAVPRGRPRRDAPPDPLADCSVPDESPAMLTSQLSVGAALQSQSARVRDGIPDTVHVLAEPA